MKPFNYNEYLKNNLLLKEQFQALEVITPKDKYVLDVINNMKLLANKLNLGLDDEYLAWFSQSEQFKDMIAVEKMNRKTAMQAAKSIISIWR